MLPSNYSSPDFSYSNDDLLESFDSFYSDSCFLNSSVSSSSSWCTSKTFLAVNSLVKFPWSDLIEMIPPRNIWADSFTSTPLECLLVCGRDTGVASTGDRSLVAGDRSWSTRDGSWGYTGDRSWGDPPSGVTGIFSGVSGTSGVSGVPELSSASGAKCRGDGAELPINFPSPSASSQPLCTFKTYLGTVQKVAGSSKYFVIKSFTLEDVNASFINGLWSSTELGNKRLSSAFKQVFNSNKQVYLFFLVNGSGKFCGVAKMTSDLDYSKTTEIWLENNRWKGVFSVEWLSIKDIPNKVFHRLRVPNNENKPVTNSRDAQEIPEDVAITMIKTFNNFKASSSFLV